MSDYEIARQEIIKRGSWTAQDIKTWHPTELLAEYERIKHEDAKQEALKAMTDEELQASWNALQANKIFAMTSSTSKDREEFYRKLGTLKGEMERRGWE